MDTSTPDITILIVATRGYVQLARRLIAQLRLGAGVITPQFIVLTDKPKEHPCLNGITQVGIPDYDWPELMLRRYEMLLSAMPLVRAKRVVMLDADTSRIPHSGGVPWWFFLDESKPLFAVQHWQSTEISGEQPPYCYDKNSAAYIATKPMLKSDGLYVQGAALGGETEAFTKLLTELNANLEIDRKNNVIATWHDESHWNKYVFHNRNQVRIVPVSEWRQHFHISDKGMSTPDQLRNKQ